jgi:hypothetical protein
MDMNGKNEINNNSNLIGGKDYYDYSRQHRVLGD